MIANIIHYLPMVIAPLIIFMFSMVSAYVLKFGLPRTGINFDYVLFAVVVIVALKIGGAL